MIDPYRTPSATVERPIRQRWSPRRFWLTVFIVIFNVGCLMANWGTLTLHNLGAFIALEALLFTIHGYIALPRKRPQ